jgi:rhodanese-related sulfurtransferase
VSEVSELPRDVPPERVAELVREDGIQLIDVREPYEVETSRIPGSRHIEMNRLAAAAAELDRDKPIVFYCRVGSRSAVAVQAFEASGIEAHHLDGGIVGWAESGLPLEPEGAEIAKH